MPRFRITTPHGDRYIVHENGIIERTDIPGFKPSGKWKFVGIEGVRSYRLFVRLDHLAEWLAGKPELLYKNGNLRYTVRDCDHGTFRSWGNTQHHGIKRIEVLHD